MKIFFRELKIKRKSKMAIRRHMAEGMCKGIAQANCSAALCTTNNEYRSQKGVHTLYRFLSHSESKKERITLISKPNFSCLTEFGEEIIKNELIIIYRIIKGWK